MNDILNGQRWQVLTGDCLELLKSLPDGCVDAVVTDPPYGLGIDGRRASIRRGENKHKGGKRAYEFKGWDVERPCPEVFSHIFRVSKSQTIWGGNYFADLLPPSAGWLVWDKGQRLDQSDGELAWTSRQGALRIHVVNRTQILVDGACHPTQKPVCLMGWSISLLRLPPNALVLDPFCGSGSTGVACAREGMRFLGMELSEDYATIARRRIADAYAQGKLDLHGDSEP